MTHESFAGGKIKAITICQPFAHLICLPDTHPEHKRIENRRWQCFHRGPLLIHAGKSRAWMDPEDLEDYPGMAFGAIVGIVDMVACFDIDHIRLIGDNNRLSWVRTHKHAEGPFCFVLENRRRFTEPILWKGARGLFDVPDVAVMQRIREAIACDRKAVANV